MRFLIIGHSKHKKQGEHYFAYEPYVREMNIWLKHVDEVEVVAPIVTEGVSTINESYRHPQLVFTPIPSIAFNSIFSSLKSMIRLPVILSKIYGASKRADHIHLRCPGNIALLGCFVQIFFPKKIKTAKYAGNWDPKATQPLSYKLQKRILSNTSLTKNMQVLVYGDWKHQTKNIKSFFTASFSNSDIQPIKTRNYDSALSFIFVGSLVKGKRPQLAIEIVKELIDKGISCNLDVFGNGVLMPKLKAFTSENKLDSVITFHGNIKPNQLKKELKKAHFIILPSKSEGWPKAIAEAMFFGAIPIANPVSCVPQMLAHGERGILIQPKASLAVDVITERIASGKLSEMSKKASDWSQKYTLDYFDNEVKQLLGK